MAHHRPVPPKRESRPVDVAVDGGIYQKEWVQWSRKQSSEMSQASDSHCSPRTRELKEWFREDHLRHWTEAAVHPLPQQTLVEYCCMTNAVFSAAPRESERKKDRGSPSPSYIQWWRQLSKRSHERVMHAIERKKQSSRNILSVQFSRSVVSDSLRPQELQHARPPCPSPTPGVHSDSRPSSQWCHPAISSSVIPFSSCPHSLPASDSFPMGQLFTWGGQSTGVSALASFLPKKSQGWSPSEWTGWISLQGHLNWSEWERFGEALDKEQIFKSRSEEWGGVSKVKHTQRQLTHLVQ